MLDLVNSYPRWKTTGSGFFMCTKFFGHYCLHKLAQIALRGNVRLSITELSLYKSLKRSFSYLLSPLPPPPPLRGVSQ